MKRVEERKRPSDDSDEDDDGDKNDRPVLTSGYLERLREERNDCDKGGILEVIKISTVGDARRKARSDTILFGNRGDEEIIYVLLTDGSMDPVIEAYIDEDISVPMSQDKDVRVKCMMELREFEFELKNKDCDEEDPDSW